jgi:hypothetical protein
LKEGEKAGEIHIPHYALGMKDQKTSTYGSVQTDHVTPEKLRAYLNIHYRLERHSRSVVGPVRADAPEIVVEDETRNHLRLIVKGAKSEVLIDKSYWELLYLDFWIAKNLKVKPEDMQRGKIADDIIYSPSGPLLAVYEVSLVISGRFAAGGKPESVQAYPTDFAAGGFGEELNLYAWKLLRDISHHFRTKTSE